METWAIIAIVVAVGAAFLIMLTRKNLKDEKKMEKEMNQDYPHPKHEGPKE
jgi:uncharacterized membrane-anchored protein YhcB (DUF1043 family)